MLGVKADEVLLPQLKPCHHNSVDRYSFISAAADAAIVYDLSNERGDLDRQCLLDSK